MRFLLFNICESRINSIDSINSLKFWGVKKKLKHKHCENIPASLVVDAIMDDDVDPLVGFRPSDKLVLLPFRTISCDPTETPRDVIYCSRLVFDKAEVGL